MDIVHKDIVLKFPDNVRVSKKALIGALRKEINKEIGFSEVSLAINCGEKTSKRHQIRGRDNRISQSMNEVYEIVCWIDRELAKTIVIRSKLILRFIELLNDCRNNSLQARMPDWASEEIHGKGLSVKFKPNGNGFNVLFDGRNKEIIARKIKNRKPSL